MNYEEFKKTFLHALDECRLPTIGPQPGKEILDVESMGRTVSIYVEPLARDIGGKFHVSGELSWHWSALLEARTRFREEDTLTQLLGREEAHDVETEKPVVRVDITLRAGLMHGHEIPMPDPATWTKWSKEALSRLEKVEPLIPDDDVEEMPDGGLAIVAWQSEPEILLFCDPLGRLKLRSISVSAFQLVEIPRNWDDPDREPDEHPHPQLRALLARVRAALFAWGEVMDHFRA